MSLQLCDSRIMSSGGYISSSQVNLTRAIILWALQTPARPLWWIGKTFLLWRLGAYTSNPGVAPSSPLPTASLVLQCWSSYTASSNLFSKIVATHNTIHQDLMMALVEGHLWQSILTWVFHKLKPANSGHPRKRRETQIVQRGTHHFDVWSMGGEQCDMVVNDVNFRPDINSDIASCMLISLSLCMCMIMRLFNLFCFIVVRRYVLLNEQPKRISRSLLM